MLDAHADFILGALKDKPDLTLDEMVERLAAEREVKVVRTAVWSSSTVTARRIKTPRMPASKSAPM